MERLQKLRIAVVGCSGTGSIVIEQLARNCVGTLVLVDPDIVEVKNLNRIINSTMFDARTQRKKVDVARDAIIKMEFGTTVETFADNLFNPDVVRAVAECDIVFGCVDTVDCRHLLNKISSFYLIFLILILEFGSMLTVTVGSIRCADSSLRTAGRIEPV